MLKIVCCKLVFSVYFNGQKIEENELVLNKFESLHIFDNKNFLDEFSIIKINRTVIKTQFILHPTKVIP